MTAAVGTQLSDTVPNTLLDTLRPLAWIDRPTADSPDISLHLHQLAPDHELLASLLLEALVSLQRLGIGGVGQHERTQACQAFDAYAALFVRLFPFTGGHHGFADPYAGHEATLRLYIRARIGWHGASDPCASA